MLPDDPRHGTYKGTQAHWREGGRPCNPCRLAANRYRKRRKYDADRKVLRIVNAQAAQDHIARLSALGMTDAAIANRAGVSRTTIQHGRIGRYEKMLHSTAEAILGVMLDPHPKGWVSDLGPRRRIQALAAAGWPKTAIASAANQQGHTLTTAALAWVAQSRSSHGRVRVETRDAIAAAYGHLSMRIPAPGRGTSLTKASAASAGYAPPLAWDDIDDPNEQPTRGRDHYGAPHESIDEARVERILGGDWRLRATRAERREVARRWRGDMNELSRLTGWKSERYWKRQEPAA